MSQLDVNQAIASLAAYQPGKPVDELARELGISDIVKLASNENPRGPGERVQAALRETFSDLSRYPDGSGYRLKTALAQYLSVDAAQITLGNGSNDVLDLIARVALEPGKQAIVAEHSFVVYRLATVCSNAELVTVPAKNFGADLPAMLDAVTDDTRLVFIANPNNPTGTYVSEQALTALLDGLPERVWAVVDEAYFEYVEKADYPNAMSLLDRYPNLIVTRTFSKIHGLASLRIGYSVSAAAFADLLNRARQPFNANSLALAAAEVAITDQEFIASSRQLNREGYDWLIAETTRLGLDHIPSVGNFIVLDVQRAGAEVFQALLQEGVIVRPIAEYGLPNHVRVTVGLPKENQRFITALEKVLASP